MQRSSDPCRRPGRRRPRRTLLAAAACCAATLAAMALVWPRAARPSLAGENADPQRGRAPLAVADAPNGGVSATDRELANTPTPAQSPTDPGVPNFVALVDELTALGIETARHVQEDEPAAATDSDRRARERLDLLLTHYLDAGERTLALMAEQAGQPTTDEHLQARRHVLRLVLGLELERRYAGEHRKPEGDTAPVLPPFGALGDLAQATLDVMPLSGDCAEDGAATLIDRPYLTARHEPSVLGLVQLAGEDHFPRRLATALLKTLWQNLKATGERSSEELTQLALLLLGDQDPSKRAVACRQLLLNEHFRPMLLAWLREHDDRTVAAEVAGIAAQELEPKAALDVLRELGSVLPRPCSAYLLLGNRAPEALADAYRELLASNTQSEQRIDLIAGLVVATGEQRREIQLLALHNDPSPSVRLQALFAISTATDYELTEQAFGVLLDDPLIAGNMRQLGSLVLALQNLEAAGQVNAVDRIGGRMRSMTLDEATRQRLESLLGRSLPSGNAGGSLPGTR